MDPQLKPRLIGAVALLLAGVLFIPLILNGPPPGSRYAAQAPPPSDRDRVPPSTPNAISGIRPPPSSLFRPAPPPTPTAPVSTPVRPEASGIWVVQVASLRQESGARELLTTLQRAGYAAYLDRTTRQGRPWYRVRVGPMPTQAQAQAMRTRIAQTFKFEPLVIRSRP